ncbi:3-oxoadipate enol-lactonase [Nocardioides baekrokdamisoli]|uniref:3-oxoadipate enol-lactonase n=1 Tax=Nocardioides baekrokdamisoli TaxID=1804624 RepID=A0A3G9ICW1_9ACTN|nr:alpha/beta fold hydrolase [Nocardioides baekrokdamisoli]BBH16212.1 3-oxoadipate enol-lactonase [Nocardioides baekrokdamisoli]
MPEAHNGPTRIRYEVSGSGAPLLVIPGLGSDLRDMRDMVRRLSESFQVVVLDNRGAGRSDKPDEPYSIQTMAADALAVLDAASIPSANVLGYSMGGRIGLELTLQHPERVARLILLASGARVIRTWQRNLLFSISPHLPIGPKPRQPVYAFQRQRAATQAYDARASLRQIRTPTLVLHGRSDRIAPPELAEELHAGIPGSRLEWYAGGHITPVLKPGIVVDAARTFLA